MPRATRSARGPADGVEGAGDDERRGRDAGEAVVERLHRALAGAAEAGREAARVVAQADRALARGARPGRGRRGWRRPGCAPSGDERLDAVALDAGGERLVGGAAGRALRRRSACRRTGSRGRGVATTSGWATARRSAIRAPSE